MLTAVGNAIIGYLPSLLAAVLILLAAWAAAFAIAFGKGGEEWAKKRLDNLTKSAEDQTKKKSE